MGAGTAIDKVRVQSRVRRLHRRAFACAVIVSSATVLIAATVFWVFEIYAPSNSLLDENQKTIGRVACVEQSCDISGLANDFEFPGANYLIDKNTRFFLNYQPPEDFSRHLITSKTSFINSFRNADTYISPAAETWRLVSTQVQLGRRKIDIMVGFAVKVSWRMDLRIADFVDIDTQLADQLGKIVNALHSKGDPDLPAKFFAKLPADGYELVDENTQEILAGGFWLPVFLAEDATYPSTGTSFLVDSNNLYLRRTTTNERLIATSLHRISDWRALAALFLCLFLMTGLVGYVAATTVFRRYVLFRQAAPANVEDAVRQGEGPSIEFKRGISFDAPNSVLQVLQSIASFSNTGDGVIFLGIEDDGKVKGLHLEYPKARDSLANRLFQAIRDHIHPVPNVRIDFMQWNNETVCRIFVPRGDQPLYFLNGVIYVRHGSSDVKAQPELVTRLLEEFAF